MANDEITNTKSLQDEERRKRIIRLLETEGLSQRQFAIKIGENYSNFNKVMMGVRKVPNSLPTKIVETFPGVRIDWILYGEGEMYKEDQQIADAKAMKEHMEMLPTRPRLPKSVAERDLTQYFKGKKRELCQEKPIVTQFPDYDFSLILKNNRMSPKYERGDELFFKLAKFPEWGNEFLLDTDDGPKFKRIYQDVDAEGEACVRCVSYNREEFPDFTIKMKYIKDYYRCVGVLRIL